MGADLSSFDGLCTVRQKSDADSMVASHLAGLAVAGPPSMPSIESSSSQPQQAIMPTAAPTQICPSMHMVQMAAVPQSVPMPSIGSSSHQGIMPTAAPIQICPSMHMVQMAAVPQSVPQAMPQAVVGLRKEDLDSMRQDAKRCCLYAESYTEEQAAALVRVLAIVHHPSTSSVVYTQGMHLPPAALMMTCASEDSTCAIMRAMYAKAGFLYKGYANVADGLLPMFNEHFIPLYEQSSVYPSLSRLLDEKDLFNCVVFRWFVTMFVNIISLDRVVKVITEVATVSPQYTHSEPVAVQSIFAAAAVTVLEEAQSPLEGMSDIGDVLCFFQWRSLGEEPALEEQARRAADLGNKLVSEIAMCDPEALEKSYRVGSKFVEHATLPATLLTSRSTASLVYLKDRHEVQEDADNELCSLVWQLRINSCLACVIHSGGLDEWCSHFDLGEREVLPARVAIRVGQQLRSVLARRLRIRGLLYCEGLQGVRTRNQEKITIAPDIRRRLQHAALRHGIAVGSELRLLAAKRAFFKSLPDTVNEVVTMVEKDPAEGGRPVCADYQDVYDNMHLEFDHRSIQALVFALGRACREFISNILHNLCQTSPQYECVVAGLKRVCSRIPQSSPHSDYRNLTDARLVGKLTRMCYLQRLHQGIVAALVFEMTQVSDTELQKLIRDKLKAIVATAITQFARGRKLFESEVPLMGSDLSDILPSFPAPEGESFLAIVNRNANAAADLPLTPGALAQSIAAALNVEMVNADAAANPEMLKSSLGVKIHGYDGTAAQRNWREAKFDLLDGYGAEIIFVGPLTFAEYLVQRGLMQPLHVPPPEEFLEATLSAKHSQHPAHSTRAHADATQNVVSTVGRAQSDSNTESVACKVSASWAGCSIDTEVYLLGSNRADLEKLIETLLHISGNLVFDIKHDIKGEVPFPQPAAGHGPAKRARTAT